MQQDRLAGAPLYTVYWATDTLTGNIKNKNALIQLFLY